MRLQFKFSKEGLLRFISHLDLQRLFIRAFRRAGLPVAFKGGFSPQPKMSFASALPLGYTSSGEFLEVELTQNMDMREVQKKLAAQLPEGVHLSQVETISLDKPSLMSRLESVSYRVAFSTSQPLEEKELKHALNYLLNKEEAVIVRRSKKKVKRLNVIPYILDVEVLPTNHNFQKEIRLHLKSGQEGSVKPLEILDLLGKENSFHFITKEAHREALFID